MTKRMIVLIMLLSLMLTSQALARHDKLPDSVSNVSQESDLLPSSPVSNQLDGGQVVNKTNMTYLHHGLSENDANNIENTPLSCSQSGLAVRSFTPSGTLTDCDDCSTAVINIGFNVNYFGTTYNTTFINDNGNITFNRTDNTFDSDGMDEIFTPMLAVFLDDVDMRGSGVIEYGKTSINGFNAFFITWKDVGYWSRETDLINTFQIVLIERSDVETGAFDIEYNYNQILWEIGGANDSPAVVGFSDGIVNNSFDFPGSAVSGAFLDDNLTTGLVNTQSNSSIRGRHIFPVRGGIVDTTGFGLCIPALPTPTPTATSTQTPSPSSTPTTMPSPTQMASPTPSAPPANQPPQLDRPIPDITVNEGVIDQVINLMEHFSDPENDALFFTVVGNSNREVAPSALVGQELNDFMVLKFGTPGVTTITIQAEEDVHHKTYQGSFTVTVLPRAQPILAMSKSVSQQMVEAREQVTYTLTISNSGAGMATNAHISDTLPAGLTFVDRSLSVTGLGIGTAGSAPPMLAEGVTLAANQSINISFAATINADVMANQMITNTAQITSSEMLTPMLASDWIMTQPPSVMISDTIVTEGQPASRTMNVSNNNVTFAVNLSKASALPVAIDYTTVSGSATAEDYMPMSGTLSIEAGQTEGHINLTIMDDEQAEEDETFTIQLSNPTHAVMNGTTAAVITISGNDQPPTAVTLTQLNTQSSIGIWYAGALAALLLIGGGVWAMRRKEE